MRPGLDSGCIVYSDAARRRQEVYLGKADDSAVIARVTGLRERIDAANSSIACVRLLARSGFATVDRKAYATLASLHNHGVFQAGALLIGPHAYGALLNALGARAVAYATEDVDIARREQLALSGLPPSLHSIGARRRRLSPSGAALACALISLFHRRMRITRSCQYPSSVCMPRDCRISPICSARRRKFPSSALTALSWCACPPRNASRFITHRVSAEKHGERQAREGPEAGRCSDRGVGRRLPQRSAGGARCHTEKRGTLRGAGDQGAGAALALTSGKRLGGTEVAAGSMTAARRP